MASACRHLQSSPISNAVVVGGSCWISGQLSVGDDGQYLPGTPRDEAARAFDLRSVAVSERRSFTLARSDEDPNSTTDRIGGGRFILRGNGGSVTSLRSYCLMLLSSMQWVRAVNRATRDNHVIFAMMALTSLSTRALRR